MFNMSSIFRKINKNKDKVKDEASHKKLKLNVEHPIDRCMKDNVTDRTLLAGKGYMILGQSIGEGTFSKVVRAYSKHHKNDIAVKIINRENAQTDYIERFLPRELNIITNLRHRNICHYYDIIDTGTKVFIIMEYAADGDLLEYILKHKFIKENYARHIFLQIVSGIQYLHHRNIIHRDLKCENILLGTNGRVLVTDFGFAKSVDSIYSLNQTYCGSSAYAPIEILDGMPYDGCSADVWSIGCILYIMTTGTMPFDDANKSVQVVKMRKGPSFHRMKQLLSEHIKDLIKGMLNPNVNGRLTLTDIQNSKWCTMGVNNDDFMEDPDERMI